MKNVWIVKKVCSIVGEFYKITFELLSNNVPDENVAGVYLGRY